MNDETDLSAITAGRSMAHSEHLARQARKAPHAWALTQHERSMTYGQLDKRVDALAAGLASRGVTYGDRVAVCALNRPEVIEAYYATMRLGAIVVPINFRLAASEIEYILDVTEPAMVFVDASTSERATEANGILGGSITTVMIGENSDGNGSFTDGAERYEDLLTDASASDFPVVDEHSPAYIVFTSGTTGRPKGAVLSHMNLLMNTVNIVGLQKLGENEVLLSALPFFHIAGINGLTQFFYVGGHIILAESGGFDVQETVALMEKHRVTSTFLVPNQWREICHVADVGHRLRHLRRLSWGASGAHPSTLQLMAERLPDVPMFTVFGQTEMSSATCALSGGKDVRAQGLVGRPLTNVEVRIVDPASPTAEPVGPGEVGEIAYRGPTVMQEYWRNPEATAEAFRGGWFHSGDLCRMDDDGLVTVVDRVKDMVISGGENIYTAEVEVAIDAHPEVGEVAVVGMPHPRWVETPVAFVVPADYASPPTQEEIIEFVKGRIASYKKPTRVHIVDALPRNATGKILKRDLRDRGSAASAG